MKYLLLLSWILTMTSCDPVTFVSYNISNSTSKDLEIYVFINIVDENDTIILNKKTKEEWMVISVSGTSAKKIELEQYYDSILVMSGDENVLKYIPEMDGKNIYNYKYWDENKKKKRDYEYTFEITEEDIKQ